MIKALDNLKKDDVDYGKKAMDLFSLQSAGINIEDTLVVPYTIFKKYISDQVEYSNMIELISRECNDFFGSFQIVKVITSYRNKCIGILDEIEQKTTIGLYSCIKYCVEKIFQSIIDEKTNSFRLTNGLSRDDIMPSLMIQKASENYSIVTRNSSTGKIINKSNYSQNVCNTLYEINERHEQLICVIDNILHYPSRVVFNMYDNIISIVCVEQQPITTNGKLEYIHEKLKSDTKNAIFYLSILIPNEIFDVEYGIKLDDLIVSVKGLPASPGKGIGYCRFSTSDFKADNKPYVYIKEEIAPEDIDIMCEAKAVITTRGGMTSHAAVFCRGMRIPCVVSARFVIHGKTAIVDGQIITEDTAVYLNGGTGDIYFKENVSGLENIYSSKIEDWKYIYRLLDDVEKNIELFSKLNLETQKNIAIITNRFRNIMEEE